MERSILGRLLVLSLKVIYSPSRVAVTAYGEARFDTWGVILQLGAVAFEATRLVLIQILLTSKVISLNPITSLYYVALCYFAFLCVPWIFVEYPILRETSSCHFDFIIFCTNLLSFFALNLAVFLLAHPPGASPSMSTRLDASALLDCFDCCVGGLLPSAMMLRLVLLDGKGIMSILIWLIMPSFEVANVLVLHICWENNMPIAWKFLDKTLVLKIVPLMLVLALLLSSFLV